MLPRRDGLQDGQAWLSEDEFSGSLVVSSRYQTTVFGVLCEA